MRRRFVVAITILVAIVLIALALVLGFSSRQRLQGNIETQAINYAALAVGPICKAYETYYASGHSKFRQLIGDIRSHNADLVGIEIYDTSGRILFDTKDFENPLFVPSLEPGSVSSDPQIVAAVRGLTGVQWKIGGEDPIYTVVSPHIEDWGRHRYSVAFRVSYSSLGAATRSFLASLILPTAISLALGVLFAVLLARQSLEPLEQLILGARDIGRGRLDRRINLDSNDEFEDLALTFNRMAGRLAVSVVELEESNVALQQSNVELKELDRLKSDLLANVSHELRTPLTSMQGYTEAMSEELLGPINPGQREALEVSQRNISRLLRMIRELLTFSRLESERLVMERGSVDLVELAEETVKAVSSARGEGFDLHLSVGQGSFMVDADEERLGQVLENLLTNAVKFTPDGKRIELRLIGEAETVCVEVTDQGIGIEAAEQARVFDRFYQVESSSTRRYGGIGLGLAIVKQILDAHGCGIEVESEMGVGTTFRFRLPRPVTATEQDFALARVLVVDPDAVFARQLAAQIERQSWAWRVVPSAEAARHLMAEGSPDAVILDRLLPDGDGFDLVRDWRKSEATRHLPLIVVSERDDASVAERKGASRFLRKPVDALQVVEELRGLLEPAESRCILLAAERVDSDLRTGVQKLRAAGFSWRRLEKATDISELLSTVPKPEMVLLDGRRGSQASWKSFLPSVIGRELPVLVLVTPEESGDLVREISELGAPDAQLVDSLEELMAIASTKPMGVTSTMDPTV